MLVDEWAPTVYAGSSSDEALVRSQSAEKIDCSAAEFDDMLCMSPGDLNNVMLHCLTAEERKGVREALQSPQPKDEILYTARAAVLVDEVKDEANVGGKK